MSSSAKELYTKAYHNTQGQKRSSNTTSSSSSKNSPSSDPNNNNNNNNNSSTSAIINATMDDMIDASVNQMLEDDTFDSDADDGSSGNFEHSGHFTSSLHLPNRMGRVNSDANLSAIGRFEDNAPYGEEESMDDDDDSDESEEEDLPGSANEAKWNLPRRGSVANGSYFPDPDDSHNLEYFLKNVLDVDDLLSDDEDDLLEELSESVRDVYMTHYAKKKQQQARLKQGAAAVVVGSNSNDNSNSSLQLADAVSGAEHLKQRAHSPSLVSVTTRATEATSPSAVANQKGGNRLLFSSFSNARKTRKSVTKSSNMIKPTRLGLQSFTPKKIHTNVTSDASVMDVEKPKRRSYACGGCRTYQQKRCWLLVSIGLAGVVTAGAILYFVLTAASSTPDSTQRKAFLRETTSSFTTVQLKKRLPNKNTNIVSDGT